jgi:tripartite-type tricarboxylate transporter receptor subunit TctC
MGGQIEVIFDSVPGSRPLVEGGKLHAMAIAGDHRSKALPEVRTFSEAGLPSYYAGTWFAILAPAGVASPIVSKLSGAISKLLADKNFQNQLAQSGLEADTSSTSDFAKFMADETQKWKRVVDIAGMKEK